MFSIMALALTVSTPCVALLVLREVSQHNGRLARLRPGLPRDVARSVRAELQSRLRHGAGADGRRLRAGDFLHWGALLSLIGPLLVYWQVFTVYQRAWVVLTWLPLPAVAWWLSMRRDGVRNAHRLPLSTWIFGYAVIVFAIALQFDAVHASLADYFWGVRYMTEARFATLVERELDPFFSAMTAGAVLAYSAAAVVVGLATIGGRGSRSVDAGLVGGALAIGLMAWTSNQAGVLVAGVGVLIVGYAVARAVRIDQETRQYRRAVAALGAAADAAAEVSASTSPGSPVASARGLVRPAVGARG